MACVAGISLSAKSPKAHCYRKLALAEPVAIDQDEKGRVSTIADLSRVWFWGAPDCVHGVTPLNIIIVQELIFDA